jgi:hypothetical protein
MGSDPGAIGSTPREQARAKDGSGDQVMRGHTSMAPPLTMLGAAVLAVAGYVIVSTVLIK